jgi:hypothetical protein
MVAPMIGQQQTNFSGYLLYCIYRSSCQGVINGLTGVQGHAVETICAGGLCATVSVVAGAVSIPTVPDLKCYGQVVAACHQHQTVIPMRYGTIFRNKSEVVAELEKHSVVYKSLLLRLMACDEMGIRLLLTDSPQMTVDRESKVPDSDKIPCACPGKTYLTLQKERYSLADAIQHRWEKRLIQWQAFFKALYVQCHWEAPKTALVHHVPVLSLYFLVQRKHIPDFRKRFARVSRQRPEKAMLSGPWPPYNFVQPKHDTFQVASRGSEDRTESELR